MTALPSASDIEQPIRSARRVAREITHRAVDGTLVTATKYTDGSHLIHTAHPQHGGGVFYCSAEAAAAVADAIVALSEDGDDDAER